MALTLYTALIIDSHGGDAVHVFSDADTALSWARKAARDYASDPSWVRDETTGGHRAAGDLLHLSYGESSSITVSPTVLDEPNAAVGVAEPLDPKVMTAAEALLDALDALRVERPAIEDRSRGEVAEAVRAVLTRAEPLAVAVEAAIDAAATRRESGR